MTSASLLTVILDVYSGRKNPTWTLSNAEANDLQRCLTSIHEAAISNPGYKPTLGYRGFRVVDQSTNENFIQVFRGRVQQQQMYFDDRERKIERLLLKTAGRHINESLKQSVRNAIEEN